MTDAHRRLERELRRTEELQHRTRLLFAELDEQNDDSVGLYETLDITPPRPARLSSTGVPVARRPPFIRV